MFIHHQQRGKCEWWDGLADFVADYNRQCGTDYTRTDCLDIHRTGGQTARRPEVLVSDTRTGSEMVIERKSVVWPPDHLLQHNKEHRFAEVIWQSTAGKFHDGCYELRVSARELERLDIGAVHRVASVIGAALAQLHASNIPVRRSVPIHWRFHAADEFEHEGRTGIVVIHDEPLTLHHFISNDVAIAGTTNAIEQQLEAAAAKFTGYDGARKTVLLYFYGSDLSEDDIPALIHKVAIPSCVDEIWMAKREWISEDDFEIGFERLFTRS